MTNATHVSDDAAELSAIIQDAIADLRLRDAAPDLLAALREMIRLVDVSPREFERCSGPAITAARAAIAKAAGK